jgi:Arc/MetJ-type ribon-helix-helix transcriptional regulator
MSNNAEARVTVWLSEDLRDTIDAEYINWRFDSRSQWLREAAQTRIALEDALGARDVDLPEDDDERAELVEEVVRAGVAALGEEALDSEE